MIVFFKKAPSPRRRSVRFKSAPILALSLALPIGPMASVSVHAAGSNFASPSAITLEPGSNIQSNQLSPDQILLEGPEFLPVAEAYQIRPSLTGTDLHLNWTIAPGYYLYKHQFSVRALPGSDPQNTLGSWQQTLAPGRAIYDDYYEKNLEVYYDHTLVILSPTAPDKLPSESTLAITSQGCADAGLCYPPRTQYLKVDHGSGSVREISAKELEGSANPAVPKSSSSSSSGQIELWVLLGFALLGGLILNLMPCVFPVLSIKVLGLTSAHLEGHDKHSHGLAYAAGVILSFVAIAVALLILRGAGHVIGWGFQLQSPAFITALAYLFFLMAQGFSGHFTLGTNLMNLGQRTTAGNGLGSSFMTGVLATVVASPCTAPFMGTALGIAITQPNTTAILIFATLGLGMALPFLLLTWIPGLAGKLPRPGPWMETFRQLLAFPLYASVLWLLWVLGRQTDIDHATLAALGLLVLTLGIWLFGRSRSPVGKAFASTMCIAGLALPLATISGVQGERGVEESPLWEPYTRARLEQLRAGGQPVFVNLTADWCITCLANEKVALSSERFETALQTHNIHYLKGDWTNRNPEITRLLSEHGRGGVPLYLFYPAGGGEARILPQLLTEGIVLGALGLPGE